MDTHTGNLGSQAPSTTEILDGLNDLLQLDHDAIQAYDVAIEKLEDRDHADQIAGFRRDHERHVRELNELITTLGGTPKNEPHATAPLKQGLQSLGGLAGDKGLLIAWRANELQVRTKYDNYASKAMLWPADVKRVIDRNALDEERHYRWVAELLERMGVAPGEGLETHALNRMREGTTGGGRMGEMKDRAGEMAGTARERVAGGLESAANRISHLVNQEEGAAGQGRMAGVANRLAGGMESTAHYVREADAGELRHDFEEQVRRNPVQTLLVAAVAGFAIGRLLR